MVMTEFTVCEFYRIFSSAFMHVKKQKKNIKHYKIQALQNTICDIKKQCKTKKQEQVYSFFCALASLHSA